MSFPELRQDFLEKLILLFQEGYALIDLPIPAEEHAQQQECDDEDSYP